MKTSAVLLLSCLLLAVLAATIANPSGACDHHRWSQIEANDAVDQEATQKMPATLVNFGWNRHHSGRCTYKREYAPCPHHDDFDKGQSFWDFLFPRPQPLGGHCTSNGGCCSGKCTNSTCTATR